VAATTLQLGSRRSGATSFARPSENDYPSAEAGYVKTHLAGKRLFNEYGDGGYLIWALYPGTLAFIDGRADLHGSRLVDDYATIYFARAGWEEVFARYDPEVVLFPKYAPLAVALRADAGWREAFTGERESVFVRAD
jgi:hypothetical protein